MRCQHLLGVSHCGQDDFRKDCCLLMGMEHDIIKGLHFITFCKLYLLRNLDYLSLNALYISLCISLTCLGLVDIINKNLEG